MKGGFKKVIVVPTYNERENVKRIIPAIFFTVPDITVLIVDDNSPDGTGQEVIALQQRFPGLSLLSRRGKEGLGKAYIHAFSEVLKDPSVQTVVMMDADLSHDPSHLPLMFERREMYDVVTGSRYVAGGKTEGWEKWRMLLSRWGNRYARMVTGMPLYDCTAGFNAINADILRKVDFSGTDMSGYAFIMELKYLLHRAGARFHEIPITFKNRFEGESKISNHIIREGILAPWKMILKK